jgi:hypothetical protein
VEGYWLCAEKPNLLLVDENCVLFVVDGFA